MKINKSKRHAVTLVEILCVMAIISILLALYLPSIARAFRNVKHLLFGD